MKTQLYHPRVNCQSAHLTSCPWRLFCTCKLPHCILSLPCLFYLHKHLLPWLFGKVNWSWFVSTSIICVTPRISSSTPWTFRQYVNVQPNILMYFRHLVKNTYVTNIHVWQMIQWIHFFLFVFEVESALIPSSGSPFIKSFSQAIPTAQSKEMVWWGCRGCL